jgi:hypothetical protein
MTTAAIIGHICIALLAVLGVVVGVFWLVNPPRK